ncbi:hypothetical protein V2J09_022852 [Rumex salicifolius]
MEKRISGEATHKACEKLNFGQCSHRSNEIFGRSVDTLEHQQYKSSSVYAPPTPTRRRPVCIEIFKAIRRVNDPTLIGGDFNSILHQWERVGGTGLLSRDTAALQN